MGPDQIPLEAEGFPGVIIHTTTLEAYRPDITGPVSLFLNLKGRSRCTVDNRKVDIPEDCFFLSNRFQPYTLEIESRQPVETFNIHIGEAFSEGVLSAVLTPADTILNHGLQQKAVTVAFYNQLHRKNATFNHLIAGLQATQQQASFHKLLFEERLAQLLLYLLQQHRHLMQQIARLPAIKPATRQELYKRLSVALDYLHSCTSGAVDLDALAATACLSKFHFLRLFKLTYGVTPYQYWQKLRLEKAEHLLRHSGMAVNDIAEALGFENSNSFSRLFLQRFQQYPTSYRQFVE